MPVARTEDHALLRELTPEAERLVERHLNTSKEWFPHELVPWSQGRDFEPGDEWAPDDEKIPPAVRAALVVNLLTEDNLPYYFRDIERMFGGDNDVWGTWSKRWTAEEGRHSIVIRDYLTVTRAVDPIELERDRMAQVSAGMVPEPPSAAEGMAYVALQELATRIAHFNTGKLLNDSHGYKIMKRVAADENFHFLFYRDLVSKAIEISPSELVIAIEAQVRDFEMPGTGIPNFGERAKMIAKAGIYDLPIHYEQILLPVVMRDWAIGSLEGLTAEGEQARIALIERIERIGKVAKRLTDRAASEAAA